MTVLNIRNIVMIVVFHRYPVDKDDGWAMFTNLCTMKQNIKFTIVDVNVIAYWIPCSV